MNESDGEGKPRMVTAICPKCGTENPVDIMNCSNCRVNLVFALEHLDKMEFAQKHPEIFKHNEAGRRERTSALAQTSKTNWASIVLVLTTLVGCIGLPILFSIQENLWRKIFSSPEKAVEILSADLSEIIFRTQDGKVYHCDSADQPKCIQVSQEATLTVRSSPWSCAPGQFNAPTISGKVIVSREVCYQHFEFASFTKFVILDDGSVWEWHTTAGGLVGVARAVNMVLRIVQGAFIGFFAGSIIVLAMKVLRRMKRKPVRNQTDNLNVKTENWKA